MDRHAGRRLSGKQTLAGEEIGQNPIKVTSWVNFVKCPAGLGFGQRPVDVENEDPEIACPLIRRFLLPERSRGRSRDASVGWEIPAIRFDFL